MSSDVQAKWMNSPTRAISGTSAKRSFSQYSTAFTSWLVVRSMALTRAASAGRERVARGVQHARAPPRRKAATSSMHGSAESAISQAISTRTRARTRPYSLKCRASGATFAA